LIVRHTELTGPGGASVVSTVFSSVCKIDSLDQCLVTRPQWSISISRYQVGIVPAH
jgi:hypothetical protein